MLGYVQFEADALREVYRERVAAADLDEAQRALYLETLDAGLEGYTYLED